MNTIVLLHFMVNLSGELFGLTQHARFYQAWLILIVTAAITVMWGPKDADATTGGGSDEERQGV